jgi:hypothetical protein
MRMKIIPLNLPAQLRVTLEPKPDSDRELEFLRWLIEESRAAKQTGEAPDRAA